MASSQRRSRNHQTSSLQDTKKGVLQGSRVQCKYTILGVPSSKYIVATRMQETEHGEIRAREGGTLNHPEPN